MKYVNLQFLFPSSNCGVQKEDANFQASKERRKEIPLFSTLLCFTVNIGVTIKAVSSFYLYS